MPHHDDRIAILIEEAVGDPPPSRLDVDALLRDAHRAQRRRGIAVGLGAAAAVLAIGGGGWALAEGGPSAAPDRPPVATTPEADGPPPAEAQTLPGPGTRERERVVRWPGEERDDLVSFGAGEVLVAQPGVRILDQRPSPDLGDSFATAGDRSAVALVEADGRQWFVLARVVGGPPQYIAVSREVSGGGIDAFITFATGKYAEGGGGLL